MENNHLIGELMAEANRQANEVSDLLNRAAEALAQNAQGEGFAGFQIVENADVPDGEIWIYDKSKITTQATPNAHE